MERCRAGLLQAGGVVLYTEGPGVGPSSVLVNLPEGLGALGLPLRLVTRRLCHAVKQLVVASAG